MPLPNFMYEIILSNKKNVGQLLKWCAEGENKEVCANNKDLVSKRLLSLSGYNTSKNDINYNYVFNDILKAGSESLMYDPAKANVNMSNPGEMIEKSLKLTSYLKRVLAGRIQRLNRDTLQFLKHNGVDLAMISVPILDTPDELYSSRSSFADTF